MTKQTIFKKKIEQITKARVKASNYVYNRHEALMDALNHLDALADQTTVTTAEKREQEQAYTLLADLINKKWPPTKPKSKPSVITFSA